MDLRKHRPGHLHRLEQLVVPVQGSEVHEHGPAGVGDIGHVTAGEVPDQPGVHGPKEHGAPLRALPSPLHMVEDPLDLGPREVRREGKPGLGPEAVLPPFGGEAVDDLVGAGVLPADRVVDRPAGVAVPHQGRLPLVGDPQSGQVGELEAGLLQGIRHHLEHVAEDLLRILLDPSGPGEELPVLLLGHRHDPAALVEQQAARRGAPLVDGCHVGARHGATTLPASSPRDDADGAVPEAVTRTRPAPPWRPVSGAVGALSSSRAGAHGARRPATTGSPPGRERSPAPTRARTRPDRCEEAPIRTAVRSAPRWRWNRRSARCGR